MLYSLQGLLTVKRENFVVMEVGGVGYKIFLAKNVVSALPSAGAVLKLFCYHHVREDEESLYGFREEKELELFERLISISGIGPKSALGIMSIAPADRLVVAINEGRIDLLTRVSGVGQKTAERVILELKGKLTLASAPQLVSLMESDVELEETLVSLGYTRAQAKTAVSKIDSGVIGFKERLREALRKTKG